MDQALLTAAAAMQARTETLAVVANNIANTSTTAYKADREFYSLFKTEHARSDPQTNELAWEPVVQATAIDFTQGPLRTTGNPLDVALEGPGFLAVQVGDEVLYTRGGVVKLGTDGRLLTEAGLALLDVDGKLISVRKGADLTLSENGAVIDAGTVIAELKMTEFKVSTQLSKAGNGLYRAQQAADPTTAAQTRLLQGHIEQSNVTPSEAAVRLIEAGRHFQWMSQATSLIGDGMLGQAVERLGRTS